MAKTSATNYTVTAEQFQKPGADSDQFDREDISKLGTAVDNHDHSSTGTGIKGLPVARIKSGAGIGSRPTVGYAGSIYYDTTNNVMYVDDGATWQSVSLTAGSITTANLTDDCVTSAKVKDGETLAVDITGDANTLDSYHAASFSLASHTHTGLDTANIADNAIDDTKVGNRVPQFYRRQGDDADGNVYNWWTSLNDKFYSGFTLTNYTPTTVRMQMGQTCLDDADFNTVTFPVAFSYAPLVLVTSELGTCLNVSATTATTFTIGIHHNTTGAGTVDKVTWLAIGPE